MDIKKLIMKALEKRNRLFAINILVDLKSTCPAKYKHMVETINATDNPDYISILSD